MRSGLQLLLDRPERVAAAALLCTGAKIGDEAMWTGRIAQVSMSGTPVMVSGSAERWFGPGFLERNPEAGSALLHALQEADDEGYSQVCAALADLRRARPPRRDRRTGAGDRRLPRRGDPARPAPRDRGRRAGRDATSSSTASRTWRPPRRPTGSPRLLRRHFLGEEPADARDDLTVREVRDAGMVVRREVLGDAHVDRATAGATDLTREFQEFITEYAWGGIWTRPGLDRRSRSLITLTALIARGHHEELAMHVRAARTNGLTVDEIKEVIMQTAIYCGVPDANTAFRIAQQALADEA